ERAEHERAVDDEQRPCDALPDEVRLPEDEHDDRHDERRGQRTGRPEAGPPETQSRLGGTRGALDGVERDRGLVGHPWDALSLILRFRRSTRDKVPLWVGNNRPALSLHRSSL